MRIVAGRHKGKTLAAPRGQGIRPTADRLRETLFNVLAHGLARHEIGDPVAGARVLDLFAGTGALGLEALSRGAVYAVFVDEGAEARGLLRANVEALGVGGVTRILRRDATRLGQASPFEPFHLVFLDPPYSLGLAERALASVMAGGWLAPGGLCVVEERAGEAVALPDGLELLDQREAGEGQFLIARATPRPPA
jgi:16S rRNA (guanine966-N2)-methyltransferase